MFIQAFIMNNIFESILKGFFEGGQFFLKGTVSGN